MIIIENRIKNKIEIRIIKTNIPQLRGCGGANQLKINKTQNINNKINKNLSILNHVYKSLKFITIQKMLKLSVVILINYKPVILFIR